MATDLRKKLEEETGEAVKWEPAEGNILVGVVRDIRDVETTYGAARLAEIENEENGETLTVWFTEILKRRFMQLGIRPGDRVGLKYFGKLEGHGDRSYHHYSVRLDSDYRKEQRIGGSADLRESMDAPSDDRATRLNFIEAKLAGFNLPRYTIMEAVEERFGTSSLGGMDDKELDELMIILTQIDSGAELIEVLKEEK